MLNWTLYAVSVVALVAALWQVARAANVLRLPAVVTLCVAGGLLVYLSSLIPGMLRQYTPPAVAAATVVLSAAAFFAAGRTARAARTLVLPADEPDAAGGPWNLVAWGMVLAALVLGRPWLDYAREVPSLLRKTDVYVTFDSVSYHLPALIDYAQHKSLWYLKGPFSSYSYAFELIYGYPMLFSHSHWTLVPAAVYSLVMMVAGIALVGSAVARAVNAMLARDDRPGAGLLSTGRLNGLVVGAVAVGVYARLFPRTQMSLGKNDLFLGACLIAALGLLLESARFDEPDPQADGNDGGDGGTDAAADNAPAVVSAADAAATALQRLDDALAFIRLRRRVLLGLSIAALGLAVGTKPTALPFVLFFMLLAALARPRRGAGHRGREVKSAVLRGLAVGAGAGLVGGFWYVRNLIKLRHLFDPANARGLRMSLANNWRDPRLYRLHHDSAVVAAAAVSVLVLGVLILFWRWRAGRTVAADGTAGSAPTRPRVPIAAVGLLGFLVTGVAVFAVSPFVLFRNGEWFLRLGLYLFAGASVVAGLAAAQVAAWRAWRGPLTGLAVAAAAGGLMIGVPLYWSKKAKPGLAHYDVPAAHPELPPSPIYQWVQALPGSHRIYAAGLRPYGLYGKDWRHRLFYDSHSHALAGVKPLHHDDPKKGPLFYDSWQDIIKSGAPIGQARLLAVLNEFNPDLLVVAVEHDDDRKPPTKPLIDWLRQQPWLTEVYGKDDPYASAFEVRDGWRELLSQYNVPPGPVRPAW